MYFSLEANNYSYSQPLVIYVYCILYSNSACFHSWSVEVVRHVYTELALAVQSSPVVWTNHPTCGCHADPLLCSEAPLHVVGPLAALPHLCKCKQAISVGVLYMCLTSKSVCRSPDYIPTLVTLYSTSLCGTLRDKQAWAMQVLLQIYRGRNFISTLDKFKEYITEQWCISWHMYTVQKRANYNRSMHTFSKTILHACMENINYSLLHSAT